VAGTLNSNDGSKLTVTGRNNQTVTVNTTNTTKVTRIVDGKLGDISDRAVVAVHGTAAANNTVAADQIVILPSGMPTPGKMHARSGAALQREGVAIGTVSPPSNGTFTVTDPDGTKVTVTTSSSTKVVRTTTVAVKELTVNQPIVVKGTRNADGSVTATAIRQNASSVAPGEGKLGRGWSGFGRGGPGGHERGGHPEGPEANEKGESPSSTTSPPSTKGGTA
jgi:hypothetical protein